MIKNSSSSDWILITGSSGFIGINLIKTLLLNGFKVIGIDSATPKEQLSIENFIFKKINLLNIQISDIVENYNIKWLIHLAGISSSRICAENPELAYNVNVQGSINILSAFKNASVKPHVILPSSSEVYGIRNNLSPLREDDKLLGNSPYAFTKIQAETAWQYYANLYDMKWTILRFSNTFGRKDAHEGYIVEYLINKCLKNENPNIRTPYMTNHFLFVTDHINAYVQLLSTAQTGIFNIAGIDYLTISDLYRKICSLLNKRVMIIYDEQKLTEGIVLDIDKAIKELNWKPKFTVNDGLQELLSK